MAVFLGENGVLTMGNKTPVTILQETLQRRGLNPQYELIYNGVGTLDPVFKFQVSAAGFTAIGDGKSKKEAKHDAAAALLRRMQTNKAVTENSEVEATEEMDIASPYSGALKQNFVGMLDETCVTNKIPLPVYNPVREEGPPHARIFTMQCKVSTCTEVAVARTKKQAKHMVAQQMINRIADILGDRYIPLVEKPMESDEPEEAQNLKAIESGSFRHDLSIPIVDLHNVFYHRTEEFLVPQMFLDLSKKPKEFYEQLEKPKEFLDELIRGLEGTCKTISSTILAIREGLEEIGQECEMFWWGEEESVEEEEVSSCSEDEDKSYVGKYKLEEFELSDEETTLISHNQLNAEERVSPQSLKEVETNLETCGKKLEELGLEDSDNKASTEKAKDNILDLTKKTFPLFISIECPQGTWAFRGLGETWEEAVNVAAIDALKFLRIMSIPSEPRKSTENEDT